MNSEGSGVGGRKGGAMFDVPFVQRNRTNEGERGRELTLQSVHFCSVWLNEVY